MLEQHVATGAALTIGAVEIPAAEARRFGILGVDINDRVISFEEKPKTGAELPGKPGRCLGSMGIYIFDAKELARRLRADAELGAKSSHDFGKDVIPAMFREAPVYAHHFVDANPPDTRLIPVSRTGGADRVVDEMVFCFTHTCLCHWGSSNWRIGSTQTCGASTFESHSLILIL
jgi:NDP-sugar pyrophosphorylase family protein